MNTKTIKTIDCGLKNPKSKHQCPINAEKIEKRFGIQRSYYNALVQEYNEHYQSLFAGIVEEQKQYEKDNEDDKNLNAWKNAKTAYAKFKKENIKKDLSLEDLAQREEALNLLKSKIDECKEKLKCPIDKIFEIKISFTNKIEEIRKNFVEKGLYHGDYQLLSGQNHKPINKAIFSSNEKLKFKSYEELLQIGAQKDSKSLTFDLFQDKFEIRSRLDRANKEDIEKYKKGEIKLSSKVGAGQSSFFLKQENNKTFLYVSNGKAQKGSNIIDYICFQLTRNKSQIKQLLLNKNNCVSVSVHREFIGTNIKYKAIFCIKDFQSSKQQQIAKISSAVAIDAGWRKNDSNGLKICYYSTTDNKSDAIFIDNKLIELYKKSQELKSLIDNNFNLFCKDFGVKVKEFQEKLPLPEWFLSENPGIKNISYWKSPQKLKRLLSYWATNRFENDQELFDFAKGISGRNKDKNGKWVQNSNNHPGCLHRYNHLNNWKKNIDENFKNKRKDLYNKKAHELKNNYEYCFVEKLNLSKMVHKKGNEKDLSKKSQVQRANVAPSIFRQCLKNLFGDKYIEINPFNTSKKCNFCGSIQELNHYTDQHTCTNCEKTYDRDENASRNILEKGCEFKNLPTPVFASGAVTPKLQEPLAEEFSEQKRVLAKHGIAFR